MSLIRQKIEAGVYYGTLTTSQSDPDISLVLDGKTIGTAAIKALKPENQFQVQIEIPSSAIHEGTTVMTIIDAKSAEVLDFVTIVSGQTSEEMLHSKLAHLEAELDLMKSVLRKMRSG